jgi:hypothetical protein
MRGQQERTGPLFSYICTEECIQVCSSVGNVLMITDVEKIGSDVATGVFPRMVDPNYLYPRHIFP